MFDVVEVTYIPFIISSNRLPYTHNPLIMSDHPQPHPHHHRHHHHHAKHHRGAELVNWGESEVYSLRNVTTGMYLAAHEDGQLVCEDADLKHHDIPWNISYHPHSRKIHFLTFPSIFFHF
jgi:hypothetical protein